MSEGKTPWSDMANEERDGVWADFSAWQSWLLTKMPDDAACTFDGLDDTDAWKENLYAVMGGLVNEQSATLARQAAEIERLEFAYNTLVGGVRDLQRHCKVAIDERIYIPSGMLAVLGAMHKAIDAEKEKTT